MWKFSSLSFIASTLWTAVKQNHDALATIFYSCIGLKPSLFISQSKLIDWEIVSLQLESAYVKIVVTLSVIPKPVHIDVELSSLLTLVLNDPPVWGNFED